MLVLLLLMLMLLMLLLLLMLLMLLLLIGGVMEEPNSALSQSHLTVRFCLTVSLNLSIYRTQYILVACVTGV